MNLKDIFLRFKYKIGLTLFVVLIEGIIMVLFPLFIGKAVDSGINGELSGIIKLGILCFVLLVVGAVRRFYDTRIYAGIYRELAVQIVEEKNSNDSSKAIAHVNLLNEVVDFFESSLPQLIGDLIGLFGTIAIVCTLDMKVFYACIVASFLVFIIYWITSNKTLMLNTKYNNEYEKQVDVYTNGRYSNKIVHFRNLMYWKIRLSDLETVNFSFVWIVLSLLLCYSILLVFQSQGFVYGIVFSIVMYVFQFMENTINIPYYYQQTLRLKDISNRINNSLNF